MIAEGVVTACKAVNLSVPLVVRMKGTNEELGKKIVLVVWFGLERKLSLLLVAK